MKLSHKSLLFLIIISFALSACSGLKTPAGGGGTPPPGGGGGTPPPGGGGGSPTGPLTIRGLALWFRGHVAVFQNKSRVRTPHHPALPGSLLPYKRSRHHRHPPP